MPDPAPTAAPPHRLLHLANGDAAADLLRDSGLPGTVAVWADVLYEGPVPRDPGSPAGRAARADFLASRGWTDRDSALAKLQSWYDALDSAPRHDEVVLWLEHDLFDQLLLIHHLDRFRRRGTGAARLALVCIADHPDVERFQGLGQLAPDRLAALFPARSPIGHQELELGERAWAAFTAPDPAALEALARSDLSALPHLAPALRRLLEEFPSTDDGLGRTERQILEALAAGPLRGDRLWRALHLRERAYFVTDLSLAHHLRELSSGARPLLSLRGDPRTDGLPGVEVGLEEGGRELLAGRADGVGPREIDRWIGGVRLRGGAPMWRWDRGARRLAPPA